MKIYKYFFLFFLTSSLFAQFPEFLIFPEWPEFGLIGLSSDIIPPRSPILALDTLGTDSTQLTLNFRGDATLDSFFARWDTTDYPASKAAGSELLTGGIGDTVNLIKWDYDLAYSSHTVYVRVFVQDTIPNSTYGQILKADAVPPDTALIAVDGTIVEPNSLIMAFNPGKVSARDFKDVRIYYTLSGGNFGAKSFATGFTLPKATLYADTNGNGVFDSTLIVTINAFNPSYLEDDTVAFADWYLQLRDSLNNSINTSTVKDTFYCHKEEDLAVDSIWISTNGDSIFVRIDGNPTLKNTWASVTNLKYPYGVATDYFVVTSYYGYWIDDKDTYMDSLGGQAFPIKLLVSDGDIDNDILNFPLDETDWVYWGGEADHPYPGDSLFFCIYTSIYVPNHPKAGYSVTRKSARIALDTLVYPVVETYAGTFNYLLNFVLK